MFESATEADLPFIRECAKRFRLDEERIEASQFIVVREAGAIVAFGRIKPYRAVHELGGLGVVEGARGRGLGCAVVRELVRRFPTDEVYLTTDLTDYFRRFGFETVDAGPAELLEKIRCGCCQRERVVVMRLERGEASLSQR
jgi:N-acetylglutamate synthase-like GNAT family acetyltransferase